MTELQDGRFYIHFSQESLEDCLKKHLTGYTTICAAIRDAKLMNAHFLVFDSRMMYVYDSAYPHRYTPEFEDWWTNESQFKNGTDTPVIIALAFKEVALNSWKAALNSKRF